MSDKKRKNKVGETDQPVELYSITPKSYHPMPMANF